MGNGERAAVYTKGLCILSGDILRQPSGAAGRSLGRASRSAERLLPLWKGHPEALDTVFSLHCGISELWEDAVVARKKRSVVSSEDAMGI